MEEKKKDLELKEEQKLAINHEQGNLMISASAGSGKTFVMISRLIRLVKEKKAKVSEILAMTYTEAAALDMKEKLTKGLAKEIAKSGDKELYSELLNVRTSDICTIDSFCARLVRVYFFKAGLSPDFKIIDDSDKTLLIERALEKTFASFYENNDKDFLRALAIFKRKRYETTFRELLISTEEKLATEVDSNALIEKSLNNCYGEGLEQVKRLLVESFTDTIKRYMQIIYALEEDSLVTLDEKSVNYLAEIKRLVEEKILSVKTVYDILALESLTIPKNRGFNKNDMPDQRADLDFFKEFIKKHIKTFCGSITYKEKEEREMAEVKEDLSAFFAVYKKFSQNYTDIKREENVLDFADLERFTYKLLQDEEVRDSVREKYKYVFVDEYQDVNGLQEEIIKLVSSSNLFMVGDVKQSIYGFRGCRPEIFEEKFKRMEKENKDSVIKLNHNFRSTEKVLDLANQVFDYSMTLDIYGLDYKKTSRLQPGGIYPEEEVGEAFVYSLIRDTEEDEKITPNSVYDILGDLEGEDEEESAETALYAHIINQKLGMEIYDAGLKKKRKATFSDIAILSRTNEGKYIAKIAKGLAKRGIPVATGVADNVLEFPEVYLLTAILRLIDCFMQDVPLVTVLKSPVANVTMEELLKIKQFYDKEKADKNAKFYQAYFYYLENGEILELKDKLIKFNCYIESLRKVADFLSAKEILNKVIEDFNLEAYYFASLDGKNAIDRMRYFVQTAETNAKGYSIREFLKLIDKSSKTFEMKLASGQDAVKVSTMHSSKGLEYPIVLVGGLANRFSNRDETPAILFDREFGFSIEYYDKENRIKSTNIVHRFFKERKRLDKIKEELRLFYVALTRPTNSLNIILDGKKETRRNFFIKANSFGEYLPLSIPTVEIKQSELLLYERQNSLSSVIFSTPSEQAVNNMKRNLEFVYPFKEDILLPLKSNVTEVLKSGNAELVEESIEQPHSKVVAVNLPYKTDAESGTIAHKILETYNFNKGDNFNEHIKNLIENGVLTKEQVEKVDLQSLEKIISSSLFKDIKDYEILKEKVFLMNFPANMLYDTSSKENVLVQGVIDLLAIKGDSAILIDYKYSSLSSERLKERYKKQLELYAYAAQKGLNLKVEKRLIVSLMRGEIIEV